MFPDESAVLSVSLSGLEQKGEASRVLDSILICACGILIEILDLSVALRETMRFVPCPGTPWHSLAILSAN